MMHEVIIVEDNREIREGLAAIINQSLDFKCIALYENAEDAMEGLNGNEPHIALVDIHLPGMSGIEFIHHLSTFKPSVLSVVCTIYEDNDHIFDSLKSGAKGYLLKKTSPQKLIESLRDLLNGGSPMNSQIARKVVSSFNESLKPALPEPLSTREKEILEWLAQGYRYKEIGDKLFISLHTVRTHIRNIYGKLEVNTKIQAINKFRGKA